MNTYEEWLSIKKILTAAKKQELLLRKEIIKEVLKNNKTDKKTINIRKGEYKLKIGIKYKHTVDNEALKTLFEDLTEGERAIFRWKASVNLKDYETYSGGKADDVITVKPGTDTLNITKEK